MKKDKFTKNARNIFQKSILKKLIIFLLLVLSITFILSINFIPGRVTLKEGEVATKDIIARETIEYTDENATVKLKEEAAKSIREVYNLNLASIENVENELSNFFADLKELRNEYNASQSENDVLEIRDVNNYFNNNELIEIREKYSLDIENSTISNLITIDTDSLQEIEQWLFLSIRKIMEQGIKEADIEEAKKQIAREISKQATNPYLAIIASEMGESFLKPSLFLDIEATEKKIQDSIDAVRDVKSIIRKDQIIIRKGEVVNAEHIEKMKALGLQNPILHYQNILGLFFIDSLFIFLIGLYIFTFHKKIFDDVNKLILLSIIYISIILIAKVSGEISGYLIPVASASMLIAITIDSRLALWMTFIISSNIGFIFLGEINYMIVALAGGFISIFSIRKATQRSNLTRAGLLIAATNIFTILALGLVQRSSPQSLLENSMWGALNGFISAILTIGVLPFLESFFDITSSFKLMELSNPNQPLLKQLLVEAPGTYHHSVVVGNLAETAAEEIGANSLLTRVGAYYHDIGKLKRPYFFSENQEAYKNTHDDMEPSLSALVIASHVKDGVDLAKKYKLPKAIIDIINQHHGTGLITYFYHRALQSNESKNTSVNEENYRYSGPKPQTKEAGIILLADSLEAEARTLNNPTSSRIKNLTQNVVKRNLENGQLDECNLTLRDLDKIKDVFSRILTGMFHNRVEYPDEELINKLKKERNQSDSSNKKQTEKEAKFSDNRKNINNSNGSNGDKKE
ncbi:MAG: HDIG domain-containing protein [Atribacterota bacterium]|nr:HDIG domain-containing protein [Atribacterota bacterium]